MKVVLTGKVIVEKEDGGCAQIAQIDGEPPADEGFFVRLQSWSEKNPPEHPEMDQFKGKRVRVTVETIK